MPLQFQAPRLNNLSPLGNSLQQGIGLGRSISQNDILRHNAARTAMQNKQMQKTMANTIAAQNAQNQGIANTAIPMANANLGKAREAVPYMQAQVQHLMHPPLTGGIGNLMQAEKIYHSLPDNDPRKADVGAYITKQKSIRNRLSMSQDGSGNWTITEGGAEPVQTGISGNDKDGLQVSPGSHHSRYSTGGETVYDPKTGHFVSVPTTTNANTIQAGSIAENFAPGGLYMAARDVLPYVGLSAKKGVQYARQVLGGSESPKFDRYEAAIKTAIPHTADNMLAILGLRKTGELYAQMLTTLEPKFYDSKGSFTRKTATVLAEGLIRQKKYNNIMKLGITLNTNNPKGIVVDANARRQLINTLQYSMINPMVRSNNNVQQQPNNAVSGLGGGANSSVPRGNVLVVSPDGHRGYIPSSQLNDALSQGYNHG